MKNAYIFTGGEIFAENIHERPEDGDIVIAADSGYKNALLLGVKVDIFVGDFDSYEGELPDTVEVIELPREKDLTDTQVAFGVALKMGADNIYIIGGLSGRLDHTLSNLAILEDAEARKVGAVIADGYNRVRYLKNSSIIIAKTDYRYIGLLTVGEKASGVEIDGVKYPLKNAKLNRREQYAVSNEITGNCAFIAVRKGGIFIIESRDKNG